MQIWIHDSKMRKIVALNNDIPDMLSYTNSAWHPYLDQATSTFDFTIPKFLNGKLHEDIKLINDECFVSFYVNDSYQVFYIATLQEDDFNIQLTCNNTNLEYALEYANPFSSESAQTIEWYLNQMGLLSFAAVEIGLNEISDRKRTLTFDSQETKMNRLQSLMSNFEAEFEFKVELNRDGTYKRIAINIYQKDHIGTDRKDVVLYYSNGLKGVQVSSDKTQMFNAGVFDGKNGVNLANVEFSEKNADGVEEFYSRKGDIFVYAPLSMQRYPATMRPDGQDNWIRKDFQTEYENVNDLKAYALRTLKQYAYPLITYTASVQSGFVSQYTDLKLGDTIRIIDNNFAGGLALEARVSEMIISFDNPANNSFVFTNYRKIDNKPSAALQTRIEQVVESKLPYRIELATTGGVTFKNNEGETIVKPSLYKGNLPCATDVTWSWALDSVVTVGMQYRIQAKDITDSEVLTVAAYVGNIEVATTEITLTNVNDGKKSNYYSDTFPEDNPKGTLEKGDSLFLTDGDTVKQYYWNGTEWVINPIVSDVEALKKQIAEDLKDVPNREEFENKISEELANSKAEIETQIETAKTQAESNAKEYADTINQETAKVAEQAKTAADEIKADLVNVKNNLTSTSIVANNAQAAVDEAKQDLTEVANDLSTAKQDLTSHAQQLQTQANAQTELTKRVTTVETTANGTKTTVNELTKTVAQNGKDITSVTAQTKTVEDDLANTKTTLTQVQTTANSTSQKTATLETGLNGVKADLVATTATADTTKTNLANYQASNDRAVANLQSNLQTANGNISSLQTKVEAVPGQITSAVSAVEGKIPTSVGGRNLWIQSKTGGGFVEETLPDNHITGQKKCYRINSGEQMYFKIEPDFSPRLYRTITFSAWVKYDNVIQGANSFNKFNVFKHNFTYRNSETESISGVDYTTLVSYTGTSDWKYVKFTKDYAANKSYDQLKGTLFFNLEGTKSGTAWVTGVKIEFGSIPSDYSPAPEDTESDINAVSSQIKQTADGMTLLATKTELNSAKTELQSGISTATNKANNAQATANNNAQTISTHTTQISALNTGLSAKVSQTDFNTLSGRVTTAENNITAKANELSSKITSVEGKIPTSVGGRNLLLWSADPSKAPSGYYGFQTMTKHDESFNGSTIYSTASQWNGLRVDIGKHLIDRNVIKVGETLTFSIYSKTDSENTTKIRAFQRYAGQSSGESVSEELAIGHEWEQYSCAFEVTAKMLAEETKATTLTFTLATALTDGARIYFACPKIERGNVATDYSPSPEDYDSKLATVQSEFKQTTDSIKASVQSLDNNTVKSSSLTINTDGVVIKAGKSTSDFANAVGSYFSVNQNAINLFSDKINVKGNMIVSGAITSDKIASQQINTAHLNGKIITADVISSNAVTADAIRAGAVTTDKMSANSINGDRITAGTLDAAKIKAGSITASQIASGTITSAQIKAGTISAANIATGAITSDKIASNSIDASKIAANAITANMITGGQLRSTNGATVFDLNAGTLTFNNNYGYIQRVAGDKIFEITTYLGTSLIDSRDYLTSAFNVKKSDNSRQSGIQFSLYNMLDNKPTATAKINSDSLTLYNSQNTMLFSVDGSSTWLGNFNLQGWGDIPVAQVYGGLIAKDIGIRGRTKSILKIVDELCNKTGVWWT